MGQPWNNIWYKFNGLGTAISKLVAENPATLTYEILNQRNPFTYADMALNRFPTIEWTRPSGSGEALRKICVPLIYPETVMRRIVYKTDENGITRRYTELRMRGGDNNRRNACLGISKKYLYESIPLQAVCDWDYVFTPPATQWEFYFTLVLLVVDHTGGLKYYYANSIRTIDGTPIPPAPDGRYGYCNVHLDGYIQPDSESNVKCFRPIIRYYNTNTQTFDDNMYNAVIMLVADWEQYNLAPPTGYYGSKVAGMMAYLIPFTSSIRADMFISDILYGIYPTTASSWTEQNIVRASVSGENAIKEAYNVNKSHADETLRTYQQKLLANHTPWAGTYVDRTSGEFVLWQGHADMYNENAGASDGELVYELFSDVRLQDNATMSGSEMVINANNDVPINVPFIEMADDGIPSVEFTHSMSPSTYKWRLRNSIAGYMEKYPFAGSGYGLTFNLEIKGAWAIMTEAERRQAQWSSNGVWFFANYIGINVQFVDDDGNKYIFAMGDQFGELYQYNLEATPYEVFGNTRTKVTLNIDNSNQTYPIRMLGGRSYGGRLNDDWATTLINTEAEAVYDLVCI